MIVIKGKQKQEKHTSTFFEFRNAHNGILLSTNVAARGLDIPEVNWIIQYDPPDDPRDYIYRVGRTARAENSGKSLLFLMPSELGFLRYLADARVPLNEYQFPQSRIANVQSQVCPYVTIFASKGTEASLDREASPKELLSIAICSRGLSGVSSLLCLLLTQEYL